MLSWVNEIDMEELELEFSGFLGARQGVFGLFGLILILDLLWPGVPFLNIDTCAKGGLFISVRVFSLPWMTGRMDGWMDGRVT